MFTRSPINWFLPIAIVLVVIAGWLVISKSGEDPESGESAALKPEDAELAKDKQEFIWLTEHLAFELETHFGRPFLDEVIGENKDGINRFLLDDFKAHLITDQPPRTRRHAIVEETSQHRGDTDGPAVGSDEFVDWIASVKTAVGDVTRKRLRVLRLDKQNDDQWKVRVLLTLAGGDENGVPTVLCETEQDVVFRVKDDKTIRNSPIILSWDVIRNDRRTSSGSAFEEVSEQWGLNKLNLIDNWNLEPTSAQQYWSQFAVEDFDNDGFPDIAVATFLGQAFLLHNEGGKGFKNIAAAAGLQGWAIDNSRLTNLCGWIDYDNDGFADLMMGDRLYHNENGTAFTDVTADSGLSVDHHPMGFTVVDYNCDGLLDIYVLYQEDVQFYDIDPVIQPWVGDTLSGAENQLWKNEGGGRFRNVTADTNAGGGRRKSFAAVWHFWDEDHYPDVYIANDFGNNVLLRNDGKGAFEDVSEASGTADFATSMGVTAGDVNNDGKAELYVANMYSKMGRRVIANVSDNDYPGNIYDQIKGSCAGNRLYFQDDDGVYQDAAVDFGVNEVGWAYAPVMADFDSDGWLDIYATTGFMSFTRGKPDG